MAPFSTEVRPVDAASLAGAADRIRAGEPIAVPTETVYGLAVDATNSEAVARVYEAKGRPSFNPLIVHVADLEMAERFGRVSGTTRALAEAHWPGPLTLVVPARPGSAISSLVTAGLDTIAVRAPAHPAMRALIAAADWPLAAPSANASGGLSPTRAEHVVASLGGRIGLVLDGGATAHGIESTVVAVEGERLTLLRPGPVLLVNALIDSGGAIRSPGQLASHYTPGKPLRLNATQAEADEWLIGYGSVAGDESLSTGEDLVEAAARLFDCLHRADASKAERIAIARVPENGLGLAINDRLRRAAVQG